MSIPECPICKICDRGFPSIAEFTKHGCARKAVSALMSDERSWGVRRRLRSACEAQARWLRNHGATADKTTVEKIERRLASTTRRRLKLGRFLRENPWLLNDDGLNSEMREFCEEEEIPLTLDGVNSAIRKLHDRVDAEFTSDVQRKRAAERQQQIAELNAMFAPPAPKRKRGRPKKAQKGGVE